MPLPIALGAIAFTISLVSVGLLRRFFLGQFMDIPNERSSHTRPTPRGGGLGFILAFAATLAIAQQVAPELTTGIHPWLWVALLPLAFIGVIDDWRNVPSAIRYLVQLSVAIGVIANSGPFTFPWLDHAGAIGAFLAIVLTLICFTALINFYNFMDGLDGLVAGVSAMQLGFLALWNHQPVLWLWVAALMGFLCWNWSPAKIFMGDAGSTVLGAVVATAMLSQTGSFQHTWASVAILFPLIGDATYTLARRLINGENIFQAHRTHLYQRLHQAGWPHDRVAAAYIAATLLIALGLWRFGPIAAWISLLATLAALALGELHLIQKSNIATAKTLWAIADPSTSQNGRSGV